jgi:hypothetical protein
METDIALHVSSLNSHAPFQAARAFHDIDMSSSPPRKSVAILFISGNLFREATSYLFNIGSETLKRRLSLGSKTF